MTALPRPADRSWWLEEALADPALAGEPCPPLDRDLTADVVVIGGGYTGMWSAYFLKEREPGLDVVLLEQDICGGGPSGRNGGFVNAFYDEMGLLESRFGPEGRRTAELAARSIDEVGRWCERHDVDAWFRPSGNLGISTSPAQDAVLDEVLEDAQELGLGDVYRALDTGEVNDRFDSPVARAGVHVTHAACLQPGRLARGLRRVLLELGVRIFEGTPVRRFARARAVAETPGGTVHADRAILGLNAWALAWPEFRRRLTVRGTYIAITAPAPDALERIRWTGDEGVYDFRTALHYLRTTPDGRIAFGGGGHVIASRRRIDARFRYEEGAVADLVEDFRRWFPAFGDVELEAAWGGPVDVSGWHLPFFGTLAGGRAHFGLGFTGNGVGPCHLGGRILSGLALGVEDEATTLPLVGAEPKPFPPEPLFTPGQRIVSRAIRRKDTLEDRGRRPDPVTDALARLPRRLGHNLGP